MIKKKTSLKRVDFIELTEVYRNADSKEIQLENSKPIFIAKYKFKNKAYFKSLFSFLSLTLQFTLKAIKTSISKLPIAIKHIENGYQMIR